MELELLKYLLSQLPGGGAGLSAAILGVYIIHRSKLFPWKIVKQGQNGSTVITADMLKKNCVEHHAPIETKLDTIYERQTTVLNEMSNIKGYLEGALKRRVP